MYALWNETLWIDTKLGTIWAVSDPLSWYQQQMKRHHPLSTCVAALGWCSAQGREASGAICKLFQPQKRVTLFRDLPSKWGRGSVSDSEPQVHFIRDTSSSWAWGLSSGAGCSEVVGSPSSKTCKACFGKALSNLIELKNYFCAKCVLGLGDFCR